MGNDSSAETNNTTNRTIVNDNTLNMVNEHINTVLAETTIKTENVCGGGNSATQTFALSGCKLKSTGGKVTINAKQDQTVIAKFNCMQASTIKKELAQNVMDSLVAKINDNLSSNTKAAMEANAKATMESGFLSTCIDCDTQAVTNNVNNLEVKNTSLTNISNVIKNTINAKLNIDTIQQCIGQAEQKQNAFITNCEIEAAGDIDMGGFIQKQDVTFMSDCIQQSGIAEAITSTLTNSLGVDVTRKSDVNDDTKQKGGADSDNNLKGPFESIGDMMSAIIEGITGPLKYAMALSFIICLVSLMSIPSLSILSSSSAAAIAAASSGTSVPASAPTRYASPTLRPRYR